MPQFARDRRLGLDLSTEVARTRFRRESLEVVAQLRARPSIVAWIPIDEGWRELPPDFRREAVDEAFRRA